MGTLVNSSHATTFKAMCAPLLATLSANIANASGVDCEAFDKTMEKLNQLYADRRYMMIGGKLFNSGQ